MTIELTSKLEQELRALAGASGMNIEALVQEAIRQYLDSAAITDLTGDQIAEAQMKLVGELAWDAACV